jgi:hypothetical protein
MQDYIALDLRLKMTSISSMEAQVNKHMECWQHAQRTQMNDFDLGSAIELVFPDCTHTQLFRSLTKELKAEIKRPFFLLDSRPRNYGSNNPKIHNK